MDLGSLLEEKLGGAKGDAEEGEEDAFDRFYDAIASDDREGARAAFEHAVYEHMEAEGDEDEEGMVVSMSGPRREVNSERKLKKARGGVSRAVRKIAGRELQKKSYRKGRDDEDENPYTSQRVRSSQNFTENKNRFPGG